MKTALAAEPPDDLLKALRRDVRELRQHFNRLEETLRLEELLDT